MIQPLLAAALLFAQAPAPPGCMTRSEAADLILFTLPGFVDGLAEKCAATLPPAAFLRSRAAAFTARLRTEGGDRWAGAKAAFDKIGGEPLPSDMSDASLRPFLAEAMAKGMLEDVKTSDCATADELLAALAPLPAANLGTVVAMVMQMAKPDENDGFRICPAG